MMSEYKEAPIYFSNIFISFLGQAFLPPYVARWGSISLGNLVGPSTLLHQKN